jgi:phenylacetate-CoA ligase
MSQKDSLKLIKKAATEIPGYTDFLKQAGCNVSALETADDLKIVPLTSKKSYLVNYPHDQLIWPASQNSSILFCATSGSTGEPYYFPRDNGLSQQYATVIENFLRSSSYGQGKTLVLIGFGMGVWIGGIITLRGYEIAGETAGVPLAILPVGYNKAEIFKALKRLAPDYDQTIIVGYPPFVKELVDEAPDHDIDLTKLRVRLHFAAEAFTETFRNYVCEKAGIKDPLRDTMNIYGTADLGAMAYETPVSILIRRLAIEDPLLFQDIFGQIEKTPTLAQYNPDFIDFESVDGQIVLTGDGALPLLRYAVGDHGGVLSYDEVRSTLHRYMINLEDEVARAGIEDTVHRWPFVFVYERTDLAATLHGIIIYPEFIKEGLISEDLAPHLTERFTMATKNDIHHNQFLQVNLELQKGVEASDTIEKQALKAIKTSMRAKSSEFDEVSKSKVSHKLVEVVLWPNGHQRYFAPGTKQKWVEKL